MNTDNSLAAIEAGIPEQTGLQKKAIAVSNTRNLSKTDMKLNDTLLVIEVNPKTYLM